LLSDILGDISRIEQFTKGMSELDFRRNDQAAYAVKYALLRISEAAHRLGERAAGLCPEIEWRDIRGLGNRLRHAYDSINTGLIWLIVEKDLARLKAATQDALRRLTEGR
jgi:uncharacterized protein with HEPN domain